MSKNTAVAEAKNTAVSNEVIDFSADAGAGMEGVDKDSLAIPFLTVLQGQSPQIETVEGAKPGLIIDTITNEMSATVDVVPVAFQRRYIRWAPRSSGGGYKGDFSVADVESGNIEGLSLIDGTYFIGVPQGTAPRDAKGAPLYDHLQDTRNHFVLALREDGTFRPALISLASTQIKKSRRWMSRIQGIQLKDATGKTFTPPSYSHVYRIKTLKEQNDKGSWHGVEVEMVGPVQNRDLYESAKTFHDQIVAGKVNVTPPAPEDSDTSDSEKF